jgi:hypothetical protein
VWRSIGLKWKYSQFLKAIRFDHSGGNPSIGQTFLRSAFRAQPQTAMRITTNAKSWNKYFAGGQDKYFPRRRRPEQFEPVRRDFVLSALIDAPAGGWDRLELGGALFGFWFAKGAALILAFLVPQACSARAADRLFRDVDQGTQSGIDGFAHWGEC